MLLKFNNLVETQRMEAGTMLVNGATLPYHVIEHAIKWCQENRSGLRAIFLFSDQSNAETYLFPSDIEQAETLVSEQEGESDIRRLLATNVEYVRRQCTLHGIPVEIIALKDPDSNELAKLLKKANVVFADPETFRKADDFATIAMSFDEITALSPEITQVNRPD